MTLLAHSSVRFPGRRRCRRDLSCCDLLFELAASTAMRFSRSAACRSLVGSRLALCDMARRRMWRGSIWCTRLAPGRDASPSAIATSSRACTMRWRMRGVSFCSVVGGIGWFTCGGRVVEIG
jgi:hypothetical protein